MSSHSYRAERVEFEAIAAERRELQTERERAFNEKLEWRRARDAEELEAAIQAINEGRWPVEEKDASQ